MATAGLLVKLGLSGPRPDDLIPASSANESGHWESRGMHRYNARLLAAVGATGYGPPQVMVRWDGVRGYNEIRDAASSWFATTYVGKPRMVKDPRLCVTLPFWRDVLPKSTAAVFVLRDPVRVARSLEARDDIPMTLALAVWDRYVLGRHSGSSRNTRSSSSTTRCWPIPRRRPRRSASSSVRWVSKFRPRRRRWRSVTWTPRFGTNQPDGDW